MLVGADSHLAPFCAAHLRGRPPPVLPLISGVGAEGRRGSAEMLVGRDCYLSWLGFFGLGHGYLEDAVFIRRRCFVADHRFR